MKKILIIFMALFACSCNEDGTPLTQFLNARKLDAQFYEINLERDTLLHTKGGAEIRIGKGSIQAGNKTTIRLEVKEAYTMADIVKAGLQTKSGGRLLSSGGMIYLNVKEENSKIVKPLSVSLPSDNVEQDMQLFKGTEDKDGHIDWTDPLPLQRNATIDSIVEGRAIFEGSCQSCHRLAKDATGPSMAFIPQRRDKKWLNGFIRNSAQMIASGDPLANCLYKYWNKTAMTSFPNLSDAELEKLYRYLDQESKNLNAANYPDYKASFDSCAVYEKAREALYQKREQLIYKNGPEVERIMLDTGYHVLIAPVNLVVPKADYSTYYKFTVTTFGWYNVDVFADKLPGYEPSVLKARLKGAFKDFTNIYIIVPEARIFVEGGLLKNEEATYGFYTDDGELPLPQGKKAYILSFTEKDDHILFGLTAFTTSLNNEIDVTLSVITKEEMNQRIEKLNFKDLSITTSDAENAKAIRSIDVDSKNIQSLKPKGSDCHCFPISEWDNELTDSSALK